MITFFLMDSWTCYKSQDQSLKKKKHTFKLHICLRWKLITLKRLLELLLQGGTSNFSILLVFFVPIIDLRDEIVKFREDCHNWNCLQSVTMESLEILNDLTIPATLPIEEPLFQSQQRARYIRSETKPERSVGCAKSRKDKTHHI